ncbi:hypothetical protein [Nocardioides sediminis]|uniref:hypothetical protein n=1 Tax=Nocardioides sediminis TaxID=433648 RepID=UPI000D322933|nr:hypothetical protein [Nocardioides sediminis]
MSTIHQLLAESRTSEVVRDAHHPARRAAHELRLAQRTARTARTTHTTGATRRRLASAAREGLPAAAAWAAALVAVFV